MFLPLRQVKLFVIPCPEASSGQFANSAGRLSLIDTKACRAILSFRSCSSPVLTLFPETRLARLMTAERCETGDESYLHLCVCLGTNNSASPLRLCIRARVRRPKLAKPGQIDVDRNHLFEHTLLNTFLRTAGHATGTPAPTLTCGRGGGTGQTTGGEQQSTTRCTIRSSKN